MFTKKEHNERMTFTERNTQATFQVLSAEESQGHRHHRPSFRALRKMNYILPVEAHLPLSVILRQVFLKITSNQRQAKDVHNLNR